MKDEALEHRIAAWLERRRGDLAQAATRSHLPLSVSATRTEVSSSNQDGTAGGVYFRRVMAVSSARQPVFVTDVLFPSIAPVIDEEGSDLVEELIGISRPGSLVLPDWHRISPDHLDPIRWPNPLPPDVDAACRCLRFGLEEYIREVEALDVEDEELAAAIGKELVGFATSTDSVRCDSIAVGGIRLGDASKADQFALRYLTPLERGSFFGQDYDTVELASDDVRPPYWHEYHAVSESVLITHSRFRAKDEPDVESSQELEDFVLALQLMGYELGGVGRWIGYSVPRWLSRAPLSGQIYLPKWSGKSRAITGEVLRDAIKLAGHIEENGRTKIAKAVLHRLRRALASSSYEDQLVDSVIALEGALLPSVRSELRYRFAINGSLLLEGTASDRHRRYGDLLAVYDARSRIVHGGAGLEAEELRRLGRSAIALARDVVKLVVEGGWLTESDFVAKIFE